MFEPERMRVLRAGDKRMAREARAVIQRSLDLLTWSRLMVRTPAVNLDGPDDKPLDHRRPDGDASLV